MYNLTGFESADLEHFARVFSETLGRPVRGLSSCPFPSERERSARQAFLRTSSPISRQCPSCTCRVDYDRMTDDFAKLTGQSPIGMRDFVKLHASEFTPGAA